MSTLDAGIPIERADAPESRQHRLSGDRSTGQNVRAIFSRIAQQYTKDALLNIPSYDSDSRALDRWLSDFWRTETLLSGVVSQVVSIDKNRGWMLTGGRNQVGRFSPVFRNAENGQGWRRFASLASESFWTTNIGSITELARVGQNGPLGAIYHTDPTKCRLTGDTNYPLQYIPGSDSEAQDWQEGSFIRAVSQPIILEEYHQLGFSAVMRALQYTILMVSIYRHDKEMLFAAMPRGLLFMSGISEDDWEDAMEANAERLTAKEREFFAGLSIFFSGLGGEVDGKLLSLSQLPHNFDLESWTNLLMYGYALCFGYDPREFWPVSSGTLGTGRESEIQAIKASGKGGLDFSLTWQDNIQRELPPTLLFQFDQRDESGAIAEYEAMSARVSLINQMAAPSGPGGEPALTNDQRLMLYAEAGYIPEEWTAVAEDVVATDTDNTMRDRLLDRPEIQRACQVYPQESLVQLSWNPKTGYRQRTIYEHSGSILEAPRGYSIPREFRYRPVRRDVIYADSIVEISDEDVARAIGKWKARHPEYKDLLTAEAVDQEEA